MNTDTLPGERSDALFNYNVRQPIGRGRTSTVYLATCQRGRLHGRVVALKKIVLETISESDKVQLDAAAALHQSLHHPSIVSLLSEFSTPSSLYHVLEYSSRGTLQNLLHSRNFFPLSEPQTRGILRSIAAALVYLRNECILHRDICPSNLLINEDFRVKLSGFSLACRLFSTTSTVQTYCSGPDHYMAPEILSRHPYSLPADMWSLGSVAVTCFTGKPPVFDNRQFEARYDLPNAASSTATSLIDSLLHSEPSQRLQACNILSHSFFDIALPILFLKSSDYTAPVADDRCISALPRLQPRYPASLSHRLRQQQSSAPRISSAPIYSAIRPLLEDSDDQDTLRRFRNRLDPTTESRTAASGRRIFSAPTLENLESKPAPAIDFLHVWTGTATPPLTDDSATTLSDDGDDVDLDKPGKSDSFGQHPLLRLPIVESHRSRPSGLYNDNVHMSVPRPSKTRTIALPTTAPPAMSIVTPFNTYYLTPHTHKVARGQIMVLPSMSLLIDFREGERRSGRRGNEVLCVSQDGLRVEIYSAPHLSTPCCLVEPTKTFGLTELPTSYRKQYDDASYIIHQLKQRIPKLVLHRPEAKYTLMANDPLGDVEILSPPPLTRKKDASNKENNATLARDHTRIRFLRRSKTVEISCYVASYALTTPISGEWTRKIIRVSTEDVIGLHFVDADTMTLDSADRQCLRLLDNFLPVCTAVANWKATDPPANVLSKPSLVNAVCEDAIDREGLQEKLARILSTPENESVLTVTEQEAVPQATASSNTILSQIGVAPRPNKLAFLPVASSTEILVKSPRLDDIHNSRDMATLTTKFLPSVGWCTRTQDQDSDPRYQVLFLDGVSLAVNVGDGSVTFTSADGVVNECPDGAWDRLPAIKEKMGMFGRVVDLFP